MRCSRAPGLRPLFAAVLLVVAGAATACEKPDASNVTSPSALALLGTTSGTATYAVTDPPPTAEEPPPGWQMELGNARFTELEDGTPALMVVSQLKAKAGATMELRLLAATGGTVARWAGGVTRTYDGTVCFQLRLATGTEALPLLEGSKYTFEVVFRDSAGVIFARIADVTHFAPARALPGPTDGSPVFRDLLGCPRGS